MSRPAPLVHLETLFLIAVGGAAGAILRSSAAGALPEAAAITLVNVVGSVALGVLVYGAEYADFAGRRARLLLATGVCSSLTTYSGFAAQTALAATEPVVLASIVAANYGFGVAGVLLGRAVARRLGGESA